MVALVAEILISVIHFSITSTKTVFTFSNFAEELKILLPTATTQNKKNTHCGLRGGYDDKRRRVSFLDVVFQGGRFYGLGFFFVDKE